MPAWLLLDKPEEEAVDLWHAVWLFSCPPGEVRSVISFKDRWGNVVRRERIIGGGSAIKWHASPFRIVVSTVKG